MLSLGRHENVYRDLNERRNVRVGMIHDVLCFWVYNCQNDLSN